MAKRIGVVMLLLVTLLGGWLWGSSDRTELNRALSASLWRRDLLEARVSLLGARVSLCDADLGGVNRQLENARRLVESANLRFGAATAAPGQRIDIAVFSAEIEEAQRLVARLNAGTGATWQQ